MKKLIIFLILICLSLTLISCKEDYYLEIIGDDEIEVEETILLQVETNRKGYDLVWESSDDEIASVDEDGIVKGVSGGEVTIKVYFKDNPNIYCEQILTVINPNQDIINEINVISEYILNQIPNNLYHDLNLIFEYLNYDFEIVYSSNNIEYLTNDGVVTRNHEDHLIEFTFNITVLGITRKFSKDINILKLHEINISGPSIVEVGHTINIQATTSSQDELIYQTSNPLIFVVDGNGEITGLSKGVATLKVALADDVLSFVTYQIEVFDPISEVVEYLKNTIPTQVSENLTFVYNHPVYDVSVEYVINSPYLNNDGVITRDKINQNVNIVIKVTYNNVTSNFSKSITVLQIPVDEQVANTNFWIEQNVRGIVDDESGLLPSADGVYQRNLKWLSSYPGALIQNRLHLALESINIRLTASYQISNREYIYEIEYTSKGVAVMDRANYIKNYFESLYPNQAQNRILMPLSEDLDIIQSIVYPNTVTKLRPGSGLNGTKMPGGVKYIVIHDTGMNGADHTASGIDQYIHQQANNAGGRVASWHYTIDENEIYQHVPNDEIAWHAGDGSRAYGTTYFNNEYQTWAIGGGNQNGIGIETCINFGGNYQKTLRRTAKLVANLLYEYDLGLDAIKQHFNFSGKNCPAVIRSTDGRWEEFIKECEFQLFILKIGNDVKFSMEIENTEVINVDGIVNKNLLNDQIVNVKMIINNDGIIDEYNYQILVKGMSDKDKLSHLYLYLNDNVIPKNLSEDLVLPIYNESYNAIMEWSSSHPLIISDHGEYNKPNKTTLVTLSVKIKIGTEEVTRVFKIYVS